MNYDYLVSSLCNRVKVGMMLRLSFSPNNNKDKLFFLLTPSALNLLYESQSVDY